MLCHIGNVSNITPYIFGIMFDFLRFCCHHSVRSVALELTGKCFVFLFVIDIGIVLFGTLSGQLLYGTHFFLNSIPKVVNPFSFAWHWLSGSFFLFFLLWIVELNGLPVFLQFPSFQHCHHPHNRRHHHTLEVFRFSPVVRARHDTLPVPAWDARTPSGTNATPRDCDNDDDDDDDQRQERFSTPGQAGKHEPGPAL